MIELKIQYPFIDDNGNVYLDLIKTYAEDENGILYNVKQLETGFEYSTAVDIADSYYDYKGEIKYKPKYFSYIATENKVAEETIE